MRRVLIATGGTGGHIYPALVVAEEFRRSGWEVCFMGRLGRRGKLLQSHGFDVVDLKLEGFVSRKLMQSVRALRLIFKSFSVCQWKLSEFNPDLVLGFGSYSSVPPLLVAAVLGKPIMIHEQNVVPGLGNRLLGFFAKRICISFKKTEIFFPKHKTLRVGYPVRSLISKYSREDVLNRFRLNPKLKTLLVFGGSQGSRALNEQLLNVFEETDLKDKAQVIHVVGKGQIEIVKGRYQEAGILAYVVEYLDPIVDAYVACDLVIARSGAGTVTELGLLKLPAILVPYPYAGNHQLENAKILQDMGLGVIINEKDLKPDLLRDKIFSRLESDDSDVGSFEDDADSILSDGAYRIVDEAKKLIGV